MSYPVLVALCAFPYLIIYIAIELAHYFMDKEWVVQKYSGSYPRSQEVAELSLNPGLFDSKLYS